MSSDMVDFTPAFGGVCAQNSSSGGLVSPPVPFQPHSDPMVRQFVGIPEAEYEGIEHKVDPTKFVPSATNGVFPIGAEVECYWSEDDYETYYAIATKATDDSHDAVDFSDYEESLRLHVTFIDDASSFWLPSDWCHLQAPHRLWEAGPFLYSIHSDEPVAEFHRALRGLSLDFPSAPPTLFSYSSGLELVDAAEDDASADGMDVDSTKAKSTRREVIYTSVPTWIASYIKEQDNSSQSSRRLFQTLPWDLTAQIDNKFRLHENVLKSGTAAMSVFPTTYGSIKEALKETEQDADPGSIFFVKLSSGTRGEGIRVFRRSELEKEPEASFPGEVIVQRAVEDLLTVDGDNECSIDGSTNVLHQRRFDIRFYVVVWGGKAYLHSYMLGLWAARVYDPSDPSVENQVPKNLGGSEDSESLVQGRPAHLFFPEADQSWARREKPPAMRQTKSSNQFNPAAWRYAIADALDSASPVLDHLVNATSSDPTRFQILGGDAVIQRSGAAVLIEFNDWPEMSVFEDRREKCVKQGVCSRRTLVLPDESAPNGYSVIPPSPLYYDVATGYTAQFLREAASLVMKLEDIAELPRFREIGLNRLD